MNLPSASSAPDTAVLLRRGVVGLAVLGIVGTGIELVLLGHWSSALQLIVWPAIALLGLALIALLRATTPRTIAWVRALAIGVAVVGTAGIAIHVWANLQAGPLDRDFESTWAALPILQQWWLASTGQVGPAPTLAPGALTEIALALLIATIRHPALETVRRRSGAATAPQASSLLGRSPQD